jgi:hypothetical protein
MVQIRFKAFGASTEFGSFAPGDLFRCNEALARHLVEEAQCAEYVAVKVVEQEAKPAKTRKRNS